MEERESWGEGGERKLGEGGEKERNGGERELGEGGKKEREGGERKLGEGGESKLREGGEKEREGGEGEREEGGERKLEEGGEREREAGGERELGEGGRRERDMDGIREIAQSYYEKASEEEKASVKEFFARLDADGDGKVTLEEVTKSVAAWLSTEEVFKKLDSDGDDALDYDDVLCLYYMERKLKMVKCSECLDLLGGAYFSCRLCLGEGPDTYDLCCSCYRREDRPPHRHSPDNLLDHHSLVTLLRDRAADHQRSPRKREMEELRAIATAHYEAASPQVQSLAYRFYQSMDSDGDGWVNLSEFQAFMAQEGYPHMRNPYFFEELDRDGNGSLDFFEVLTLFYIIKSGRPFCNACARFIPGIFFSCVECFKNIPFHLCRDCYRSSRCGHGHNGRAQFLDNYTLLQIARDPALVHSSGGFSNGRTTTSKSIVPVQGNKYIYDPYTTTYVLHPLTQGPNFPNAILPPTNRSNWKVALNAFEFALKVGSVAGVAACTIM